jgi:membrane fusion protein (multidrug efflux system)
MSTANAASFQDATAELRAEPPAAEIEVSPESEADVPGLQDRAGKRTPWWVFAAVALLLVVGRQGVRWWNYADSHSSTDNAFIAGHVHLISSRVAGTVSEVSVDDNQTVAGGAALVKLDPRDFELRVEQARYQIVEADAQVAQAEAQWRQAKAQTAQAEAKSVRSAAELQKARLDFERAEHLTEGGHFVTISKQEFDAAKAAFEVAEASASVAKADLETNQALAQAAQAAHSVALAHRQTAQVNLSDAQLQLSYATIPAPVAGTLGRKAVEVGQRVQAGQALLALVADQKWVVANFKETQLARMKPGQAVSIRIDALPGKKFRGTVESFAPASGAQFALLPPDNATGNFTKIVQRVPVKIVFDPKDIRGLESSIVPGLSAVVDVDLGGTEPAAAPSSP